MNRTDATPRRFQFTLRTLLGLVLMVAVICSLIQWLGQDFLFRISCRTLGWHPLAWIVISAILVAACGKVTNLCARRSGALPLRGTAFMVALMVLLTTSLAAAYLSWTHHRMVCHAADDTYPRGGIFPDKPLEMLNDWYDARYPAPPDLIKLHGEFPRIQFQLEVLVIALSGVIGCSLGVLLPSIHRRKRSE